MLRSPLVTWPDDKKFAFTIIDDTDFSTVENTRPVYEFLAELGFRTTKTVWPLAPCGRPTTGGQSLEDPDYRGWILDLQRRGFEIALHGVADGSSPRDRIVDGLRRYRQILGENPSVHINHVGQTEGIYWGVQRFDQPVRALYRLYLRARGAEVPGQGVDVNSRYFWGDICSAVPRFVRNLIFSDINTLKMDPLMPYHDPRRPFVRYWFSGSNGSGTEAFCRLISEKNQDRLEREGGCCIVYTHLGSTFYPLRADLKYLLRRLSERQGWFVPVTPLLENIGMQRNWTTTADRRMTFRLMQLRWLAHQVGARSTGQIADILHGDMLRVRLSGSEYGLRRSRFRCDSSSMD